MWKKSLRVSVLSVLSLLMSCQNQPEKPQLSSLRIDFQEGDLPSLHPHALMIYLRGICVAKTLFECLTRIDEQGVAKLAGAKSVEVSPDRCQYTFTLRDNCWSDGSPVTAFQYEKAWKEALSPTGSCSRADLLYMIKNAQEAKAGKTPLDQVGVQAIDEKTLKVELAYPSSHFLELVAQPICAPLVNPQGKEPTEFNGPFIVQAWKKGDHLQLAANPHFWDRKQISLKQINIFMVEDSSTAFSLYEKGEIDWIGVPLCPLSTDLIHHLKKQSSLRSHPIDRAFWVFLNTERPTLRSPYIRKALSQVVDRASITKHILIGGHPLNKPLPHKLLPASSYQIVEDLDEAKECFKQGLKELGLTEESFPPLVITYSQQSNRKQIAEYLQQLWGNAFGIKVQVQAQEWNVLRSNLGKGQFEISACFEAAFYKDPLELLDRFTTLNPCNFSQWSNSLYGEKVAQAKREREPQQRLLLLNQAEKILMEQTPFIPICSDELLFAHHPDLKGYAFDYVGAVDFSRAYFAKP